MSRDDDNEYRWQERLENDRTVFFDNGGEYEHHPPKKKVLTVAIDLDGVLAEYHGWEGLDHIGDPLPSAVKMCEWLTSEDPDATYDTNAFVFTTRTNPLLNLEPEWKLRERIQAWLDKHGFPEKLGIYTGPGKPIADLYIDDRAYHHPSNEAWTDYKRGKVIDRLNGISRGE